jgi:hypothetical protein
MRRAVATTVCLIGLNGLSTAESLGARRNSKKYFQRLANRPTGPVQQPVQIVARFAITI